MARFLLLNFKDFGLNQDITQTIQSQTLLCVCCLKKNVSLINLTTCKHSSFLDFLTVPELEQTRKVICLRCHDELKKIEKFKEQVVESFKILSSESFKPDEMECIRKEHLEKKKTVDIFLPPAKYIPRPYKATAHNTVKKEKEKQIETTKNKTEQKTDNTEQEKSMVEIEINVNDNPKTSEEGSKVETIQIVPIHKIKNELIEKEMQHEPVDSSVQDPLETEEPVKKSKVKAVSITKEDVMKERLKTAMSKEYSKYQYKCENCVVGFNFEENLKDHVKRRHGPKVGSTTCDICLQVFYPPGSLNAHYYRHLTRYECEECGKRYPTFDEGFHHFNKEHEKKDPLYKCQFCKYSTDYVNKLKYHKYKHHKMFTCKECGVVLASSGSLWNHMKRVHKMSTYMCSHCSVQCASPAQYHAHVQCRAPSSPAPAAPAPPSPAAPAHCRACDQHFPSHRAYSLHLSHGANQQFKCDECCLSFSDDVELQQHKEIMHLKRTHLCPKCPRDFSKPKELEEHLEHHKRVEFGHDHQCDHCGKTFYSRNHLVKHINDHMDEINCGDSKSR